MQPVHNTATVSINPSFPFFQSLLRSTFQSLDPVPPLRLVASRACSAAELQSFHSPEYVAWLKEASQEEDGGGGRRLGGREKEEELEEYGLSYDCPVMPVSGRV